MYHSKFIVTESQDLDWVKREEWCLRVVVHDPDTVFYNNDDVILCIKNRGRGDKIPLRKGGGDFRFPGKFTKVYQNDDSRIRYFFQYQGDWWLLHSQERIVFKYTDVTSIGYAYWRGYHISVGDFQKFEIRSNINEIIL